MKGKKDALIIKNIYEISFSAIFISYNSVITEAHYNVCEL
jgi:hypothetical protein